MARGQRVQAGKQALEYALLTLLNQKDDSTLVAALKNAGHETIDDVLALTEEQLEALEYKDSNGDSQRLRGAQRNLIRILVAFDRMKKNAGQPIYPEDWPKVDEKAFYEFRVFRYRPTKLGHPNCVARRDSVSSMDFVKGPDGRYGVKNPYTGEFEPPWNYVRTDCGGDFAHYVRWCAKIEDFPLVPGESKRITHENLWPGRKLRICFVPGTPVLWTPARIVSWEEAAIWRIIVGDREFPEH